MLPKPYCLRKEKDFTLVVKKGKTIFSPEINFKFIKNNLKNSRFGFIVSTKIDKRATVRNKIKRRLREVIYQNLKKIKTGFDIIILTKPAIKNLDFWQIKEKLENLFKRSKLFKNS